MAFGAKGYGVTDNTAARPRAILAAPEGSSCKGNFGTSQFSITNPEFRIQQF